jgi:hypothetical protein
MRDHANEDCPISYAIAGEDMSDPQSGTPIDRPIKPDDEYSAFEFTIKYRVDGMWYDARSGGRLYLHPDDPPDRRDPLERAKAFAVDALGEIAIGYRARAEIWRTHLEDSNDRRLILSVERTDNGKLPHDRYGAVIWTTH